MIPIAVKQAIFQLFRHGEEICGLVLQDDTVIQVENTLPEGDLNDTESLTSRNDFQMPADTLVKHDGKIKAIWHTHWRDSSPARLSGADIRAARAVGLPYIVYHSGFDEWDYWDPNGLHPYPLYQRYSDPTCLEFYKGWSWTWARADCLTLLRSYYMGMLNHPINDFQRTATEEEFAAKLRDGTWNDYDQNLGDQGLVKVCDGDAKSFDFQLHDIVLMRLQGRMPHHVGIIVNAKSLQMLHHLESGRLSEVVPYGPGRMRQTHSVWRIKK